MKIHQLLKIALIILTLTGVQVVQASPLHDHFSHVAGCTLCHGGLNEAILPATALTFNKPEPQVISVVPAYRSPTITFHSPLQSRAPPKSFS